MRVVPVPIFLVAMCLMVLLPTEVVAYILLCVGGPAPLQVAPAFSEVSAGLAHVSNRIGRLLRSLAPHAIFVASTSEVLQVIAIEFTVLEASSCLRSFCIVAETLSVSWLGSGVGIPTSIERCSFDWGVSCLAHSAEGMVTMFDPIH